MLTASLYTEYSLIIYSFGFEPSTIPGPLVIGEAAPLHSCQGGLRNRNVAVATSTFGGAIEERNIVGY